MTYKESLEYIEEKNNLGSVLGLELITELLNRLENPQNKIKVIHIAGTNGKGSILSFIESILIESGYTVGRYISPTIFTYLERFQINKTYISEASFAKYITVIKNIIDDMIVDGYPSPTSFEIETAISFLYCMDENVDYMLLETGMGGRLDATNVVESPVCDVIASISMDHMNFLGDTLEKIAIEKSKIIKENTICVSYDNEEIVNKVIAEGCNKQNTELIFTNTKKLEILEETLDGTRFIYKDNEYHIEMIGVHQVYNSITAIEVIDAICRVDNINNINYNRIYVGLRKTNWKGRFEIISNNPIVIRDGAHNVDAAKSLVNTIEKHFTKKQIVYIIGMLKDKEYDKVLKITGKYANIIYTITAPGVRGLDSKELCESARKYNSDVRDRGDIDINLVLKEAILEAGEEGVVIVFGSLSYIGNISCFNEN